MKLKTKEAKKSYSHSPRSTCQSQTIIICSSTPNKARDKFSAQIKMKWKNFIAEFNEKLKRIIIIIATF
jgi:hypothetical protein